MYEPVSLFHLQTAGPISAKFCTDLHTNSWKVLNPSLTPPTLPPDTGVPQTPKPIQITGEKNLCLTKKIFRAAPGHGWLVYYIIVRKSIILDIDKMAEEAQCFAGFYKFGFMVLDY